MYDYTQVIFTQDSIKINRTISCLGHENLETAIFLLYFITSKQIIIVVFLPCIKLK